MGNSFKVTNCDFGFHVKVSPLVSQFKMHQKGKKMKLISIVCPNCGAKLQTTPNAKMLTCDYCNCDVVIDDEIKHVCLADAEQAGYEFEMGRQRALKELREDEEMMKKIGPLF